jgi:hypothetical protein
VNQQQTIPEGWQDDANSDHGGGKGMSAVSVTSRSSESVAQGKGARPLIQSIFFASKDRYGIRRPLEAAEVRCV